MQKALRTLQFFWKQMSQVWQKTSPSSKSWNLIRHQQTTPATSNALIAQTRSRTTANVCSMRSKKRIHILSLVKRQWTGIGLPEKMSMSDLPWGAKGEALGRRLADADENMQGEKVWWEILQRKRLQPQAMHSRKMSRYIFVPCLVA